MANATPQPGKGIVRNLVTGVVRVAFVHLTAPNTGGQYPSNKYELYGLIPKGEPCPTPAGKPTIDALREACLAAARDKWGDKVQASDIVVGIRDGDEKANLDGFSGSWFIHPKSGREVPVFGAAREALDAKAVRSGDYCRLLLSAGAYKRNLEPEVARDLVAAGRKVVKEQGDDGKVAYWRPAVTFYLNAVQLVRRGEPFGGGGAANADAFPVESADPFDAPTPTPIPAAGGGSSGAPASALWGDDEPPF